MKARLITAPGPTLWQRFSLLQSNRVAQKFFQHDARSPSLVPRVHIRHVARHQDSVPTVKKHNAAFCSVLRQLIFARPPAFSSGPPCQKLRTPATKVRRSRAQ